jgi:PD-(D/E)XK nuclease superfamily
MQKIIEIDSQILNSIQNCALKHQYQFEENLASESKAAPLEKGDLLHKVLELYDGIMGNCANISSDTWSLIINEDFTTEFTKKLAPTKRDIIDFCLRAGQFFAAKMQIDTETSNNVLFQFNAYCEYYTNDPWMTLAVEEVASRILFENEELKIVYTGKIDRFVEQGNIRAPMDHKSSERRGDVSSMSNQFIGYCFLLDCYNIIIDKIGFQKTLKPSERFQRFVLTIDDGRIDEWKDNSISTILLHLMTTSPDDIDALEYFRIYRSLNRLSEESMQSNMNLTSCDKYSGCTYRAICESNPEGREWIKERDFIVRTPWDVGQILEAKS